MRQKIAYLALILAIGIAGAIACPRPVAGQVVCTDPTNCVDIGAKLDSMQTQIDALSVQAGTIDSLLRVEIASFAASLESIAASLRAAIPPPGGGGGNGGGSASRIGTPPPGETKPITPVDLVWCKYLGCGKPMDQCLPTEGVWASRAACLGVPL